MNLPNIHFKFCGYYDAILSHRDWDSILECAAKNNDMDMFRFAYRYKKRPLYFEIVSWAAENNNIEIIKMCLTVPKITISSNAFNSSVKHENYEMIKRFLDYDYLGKRYITQAAIKYNKLDILDFIISNGYTINFDAAIGEAVTNNIDGAIQLLISKGATARDIDNAFCDNIHELNITMIKTLVSAGAYSFDEAMRKLEYNNNKINIEIIEYLISLGVTNHYNGILRHAAKYNDFEMVNFIVSKGANNFNAALSEAARNNNFDMVNEMIRYGANEIECALSWAKGIKMTEFLIGKMENADIKIEYLNKAMASAADRNDIKTVKLLVKLGANDFTEAINAVTEYGGDWNKAMIKFLAKRL